MGLRPGVLSLLLIGPLLAAGCVQPTSSSASVEEVLVSSLWSKDVDGDTGYELMIEISFLDGDPFSKETRGLRTDANLSLRIQETEGDYSVREENDWNPFMNRTVRVTEDESCWEEEVDYMEGYWVCRFALGPKDITCDSSYWAIMDVHLPDGQTFFDDGYKGWMILC